MRRFLPAGAMQAEGPAADSAAAVRPWWQYATGLPSDGLRAVPDAVVADEAALKSGLAGLVASRGTRVGDLAPSLYRLSVGHGIFSHADASVAAGTWTAADGLGTLNVQALLHALAVGGQGSNVALTVSSYNVMHGQSLTVTFTVTGGSGVPTGSVTATLKGRASGGGGDTGPGIAGQQRDTGVFHVDAGCRPIRHYRQLQRRFNVQHEQQQHSDGDGGTGAGGGDGDSAGVNTGGRCDSGDGDGDEPERYGLAQRRGDGDAVWHVGRIVHLLGDAAVGTAAIVFSRWCQCRRRMRARLRSRRTARRAAASRAAHRLRFR